jgi:predicted amidophosphoribosyltransferase
MNDITPETIICPVCKWQWDNKNQNCPNCNFPIAQFKDLLAGKRILSDDDD